MDKHVNSFVEKTLINTPEPTATSTNRKVNTKNATKKNFPAPLNFNDTSSLLSSSLFDVSKDSTRESDVSRHLEHQKSLANKTLQRASKVVGIPSRYLQANTIASSTIENMSESTISESDLLQTHINCSTPRNSIANESKPRIGPSIAKLSSKLSDTTENMESIMKQFRSTFLSDSKVDSNEFMQPDEAIEKLLEDEISWQKRNDLPVDKLSESTMSQISDCKLSMGEFFRQKSDSVSGLNFGKSPVKSHPVPLIDVSSHCGQTLDNISCIPEKTLSISSIANFLSENKDTPSKALEALLKKTQKHRKSTEELSSVPVSKNSSYTSDCSDNEVMRCIAEKENRNSLNIQSSRSSSIEQSKNINRTLSLDSVSIDITKLKSKTGINSTMSSAKGPSHLTRPKPIRSPSPTQSRTSSSLSNLPDGKLPIESTHCELVWGCVKIDKCATKEFILRNKSSKSIRIQLTIKGHAFKLRKDNRPDSDRLSIAKMLFHPHESRPIIVSFMPTVIGAAVDELHFTPMDSFLEQTKKQCIRLYGYGGYGNLDFVNITKDTSNKFWLCLGELSSGKPLTQTFLVRNPATLPTFCCISFITKELYTYSNVNIEPNFFVLIPSESKEVSISFIPTAEDCRKLQKTNDLAVLDIGVLKVVYGTEVNRGRLRRLCRKALDNNIAVDPLCNLLKAKVRGEVMPSDIINFKESLDALKDIMKMFTVNEIVLTVEQDPEQTIMGHFADDSDMFQTLCQTTILETTICKDSCKLEPTNIVLIPPKKVHDTLFVKSYSARKFHFEAKSTPAGLDIFPNVGQILPNETIMLQIRCAQNMKEQTFRVLLFVEDEVFEATVKIMVLLKGNSHF